MAFIQVELTNESTVLTDAQVQSVVVPLQTQVHRDFAPVWGTDADLSFLPKGRKQTPDSWLLGIFDNSDAAGALGYHELSPQGTPLGKVFAESDAKAGLSWTVTASHELLEMLANPDIDLTVFVQPDSTTGTLYSYECCDAVETDSLGYSVGGSVMSDFVFPSWFESFRSEGSTQFDFGKHIARPFQILRGGYIGVFDISSGSGWQQLTSNGPASPETFDGRIDSRFERMKLPRKEWTRSNLI